MALLNAQLREGTGKSVARKIRAAGRVPAVAYGHGEEARSLTIDALQLQNLLSTINPENTIVELRIEGARPVQALIREIQHHPSKPIIQHVDFQQIRAGERIQVAIPIQLHGTPVGVREGGGVLQEVLREISVECLPSEIPASIDVPVEELEIGAVVYVSDLALPNVTVLTEPELVVCTVSAPTVAPLGEATEEEGATSAAEVPASSD